VEEFNDYDYTLLLLVSWVSSLVEEGRAGELEVSFGRDEVGNFVLNWFFK
jgi:hypothetical protein